MSDEITDPDRPSRTRYSGPRFWWMTSVISVFSSTSFVITQLLPAPDSQVYIRWFVLGLFIIGLLTGIFSAMILMMSGFFTAGTATFWGREAPSSDVAWFFLACYSAPLMVVGWSVFRSQVVY